LQGQERAPDVQGEAVATNVEINVGKQVWGVYRRRDEGWSWDMKKSEYR
jgi:hypothetical protein